MLLFHWVRVVHCST